jgi:hypothetical protein
VALSLQHVEKNKPHLLSIISHFGLVIHKYPNIYKWNVIFLGYNNAVIIYNVKSSSHILPWKIEHRSKFHNWLFSYTSAKKALS